MICYLSKNYKGTHSAGNKAKTDIEKIMSDLGYRNVGLPQSTYTNSILSFVVTLVGVLKSFSHCIEEISCFAISVKEILYVGLLHSSCEGLQGYNYNTRFRQFFRRQKPTVEQEIKQLNHSDYVIAHNSSMLNWLVEKGCKAQMGSFAVI